jgi:hypothetical protein
LFLALGAWATVWATAAAAAGAEIDLSRAVVVVRSAGRGPAETTAAVVLVEEIEKRTGLRLSVREDWPDGAPVIALSVRDGRTPWTERLTRRMSGPSPNGNVDPPESRPEGFALVVLPATQTEPAGAFVMGADDRGVLFGVGRLLREIEYRPGGMGLNGALRVAAAPEYPLRGHQLGYRARANSYDAWTPRQYEQYIRELAVFGANAIENIPFEDDMKGPLMPVPREEMNRALSEICARYNLDYWVWTPADFPLGDAARRQAMLERHEALYRACPRLDAVFFPGGDPGDNPPERVIPFLKELALRLEKTHPQARIWVSLQGFDRAKALAFTDFIGKEAPAWLGGLVAGPSSPPLWETRPRLAARYGLRWYPDITHTVRCQFPVEWWDPAFALTLGREPVNPRPADSANLFRLYAPYTTGFLTYSDGIHDDVNKQVWSLLGWDSRSDVRGMLVQYARFYFGPDVAEAAADGLLGLENNWRGSLALNAGVDGVLALWQDLERRHPRLADDWRFQMHLMRAYYDAYTRHRLLHETRLEAEAMAALAGAERIGAQAAMDQARAILRKAQTQPTHPEWRRRIDELAEALFKSIGYQTSVKRFHASGAERGCIMDFIDYPLNNRWWLEDEFAKVEGLAGERERLDRLETIRTWEQPGPGSFYDEVGHVGKSPRVLRGEQINTDPEGFRHENPEHSWWDDGMSRRRLSWQHHLRWPIAVVYEGLDPKARYTVRVTGQGDSVLRGDGRLLTPGRYSREIGEFKEFAVPPELTADGRLRLTWDDIDESHLNWRRQSSVAEAWLLKEAAP